MICGPKEPSPKTFQLPPPLTQAHPSLQDKLLLSIFSSSFLLSVGGFVIYFFFNWRIIALQCCVGFCHAEWISHDYIYACARTHTHTHTYVYTYIAYAYVPPSIWASLPTHIPPFTEHQAGLPVLHSSFPLAICFTHDTMYMSMLLFQFVLPSSYLLSPSLTVSTSPFSKSTSSFLPRK